MVERESLFLAPADATACFPHPRGAQRASTESGGSAARAGAVCLRLLQGGRSKSAEQAGGWGLPHEWGNLTSLKRDGSDEQATAASYPIPQGFAGGLFDPVTGLTRFGARDYDPKVGRWTSKDPILFAGGQGNLYVYVGNDPVNRTDPKGLWDVFGFGAFEYGPPVPGPVHLTYEHVGIAGYNSQTGGYLGHIDALGGSFGGASNFGAFHYGSEVTSGGHRESISLVDAGLGVEIPFLAGAGLGVGGYNTKNDYGFYVFAHGGILGTQSSIGVGLSMQSLIADLSRLADSVGAAVCP